MGNTDSVGGSNLWRGVKALCKTQCLLNHYSKFGALSASDAARDSIDLTNLVFDFSQSAIF